MDNQQVDEQVFQEFILSIKSGSVEKVDQMLNKYESAITNRLETQMRQPPLYFAVSLPDDDTCSIVMEKLINSGANPVFKDQNEQTVMFYACRDGKSKCINLLLQKGVPIDEEDQYGQTPLFYIASQNQLHLLDHYKAKEHFNHVDKLAEQTPLYYAAKRGHLEMCKELLARGCDVTHHDHHHKTAVEYARRARQHEVTEYLAAEVKKIRDNIRHEQQQAREMQKQEESSHQQAKKKKKQVPPKLDESAGQKSHYKLVFMDDKGDVRNVPEEQVRTLFQGQQIYNFLKNPNSIPIEFLERAEQERWQKMASKLLTTCWRAKGAYWFHEAVDPVKFGIMDYFDIINDPMDLGIIKKKLAFNAYKSLEHFAQDMRLIWKNCYRYNGQQHEISLCAKDLEATFEQGYEQIQKKIQQE